MQTGDKWYKYIKNINVKYNRPRFWIKWSLYYWHPLNIHSSTWTSLSALSPSLRINTTSSTTSGNTREQYWISWCIRSFGFLKSRKENSNFQSISFSLAFSSLMFFYFVFLYFLSIFLRFMIFSRRLRSEYQRYSKDEVNFFLSLSVPYRTLSSSFYPVILVLYSHTPIWIVADYPLWSINERI